MITWVLSLLVYLITMALGLYIDTKKDSGKKKTCFIIWLFVFLCFGYMTGSDWRNYEPEYFDSLMLSRYINEPGFLLIFKFSPIIIPDFWLFLGIVKCIHLFTLMKLLQLVSEKWISILVLLFPYQVCFMLVQNPLRFMMALTFVYWGVILYLRSRIAKYNTKKTMTFVKMTLLFLLASLFHNSCLFMLLTLPVYFYADRFVNMNRVILFVIYIFIIVITTNVSLINEMIGDLNYSIMGYYSIKDYSETYSVADSSNIFSIGNILKIVFFLFILLSRDSVYKRKSNRNSYIYGLALSYCYFDRIFLLIPTGFRLVIPFMNFYIAYFILMLYTERRYAQIFIMYSFLTFANKLWFSYDLIPYSNSIPYIVTGHKDYYERHLNNVVQYKERTGEEIVLRIDQ